MNYLRGFAAVGLAGAGIFAGSDGRIVAADPQRPSQGPVILHNCEIKAVKTARVATDRPGVISVIDPKEGDTVKEGVKIVRLMDDVPVANWEVAKLIADDQTNTKRASRPTGRPRARSPRSNWNDSNLTR
jgi:multidrug efflux pump subunit AcrA (membrane-fusion protein)